MFYYSSLQLNSFWVNELHRVTIRKLSRELLWILIRWDKVVYRVIWWVGVRQGFAAGRSRNWMAITWAVNMTQARNCRSGTRETALRMLRDEILKSRANLEAYWRREMEVSFLLSCKTYSYVDYVRLVFARKRSRNPNLVLRVQTLSSLVLSNVTRTSSLHFGIRNNNCELALELIGAYCEWQVGYYNN